MAWYRTAGPRPDRRKPTLAQVRSWAGLDVHARSVVAVTVDGVSSELRSRRLPGETSKVVGFCAGLPGTTKVAP